MPIFTSARRISDTVDALRAPVLAGALYFVLAAATIALTSAWTGVAAVWPANAVMLAMLLRRQPAQWWPFLIAGAIANALANLATRDTIGAPILFSAANMLEVTVAAWGLRLHGSRIDLQLTTGAVWRFILWAGALAPMASGLIGAVASAMLFGEPFLQAYATWVVADALGLIVVTPFMITLFSGAYLTRWRESGWGQRCEAGALYVLTALVTAAVFSGHHLPLLFLVAMPLMLVTFRLGWPGTNVAVMIVAAIGTLGTVNRFGPVMIPTDDPVLQAGLFQFFLASLLLTCIPVAAAVAASRELMRELKENERSLRLVVSQSPSLLLEFTPQGTCHKAFGAREILTGVGAAELVGSGFAAIAPTVHDDLRAAHEMALTSREEMFSVEFQPAAQAEAWYEATFCALTDERGRCIGSIASIHDVTERKLQARALARSATIDSLTGLINRAGFMHRLGRMLGAQRDAPLALAMIDVDRFKLINDNGGHLVGDVVLTEIARRIAGEVREGDVVGRLGGDEFAVLIDASQYADAEDICARIVSAVSRAPIPLPSGGAIGAAISCGLARQQPGLDAEGFLLAADTALYEAKRSGRGRVVAA